MPAPNLFMLVVDSLRADAVYESRVPSPNLDALAARGAVFHQCISTTTTTTPSFSSMLTGCFPPKHGVRGLKGYRLSPQVKTMAETFSEAGYHTYAEVTGPLLPETGVLRGFQSANHRQGYRAPFFGWTDEVVSRMRGYEEPWLMLLHIWEVHRPFRPPPDHTKRWDRVGYEGVVTASDERLLPILDAADDAIIVVTGDHGEQYPDTRLKGLGNKITRRARKVLKPGKSWPWLDRKLAAQSVGHGFALYEHLIRVPLIMTGPGVNHSTIDDQVRHVDIFPTVADLCGVPIPHGIDGRSLRPLLEGGSLPEEPAYLEAVGIKLEGDRITGIRTSDWKLLKPGSARPALYKLTGDDASPDKRNLYARYPEIAHSLEEKMQRIAMTEAVDASGMTTEEEAIVEQHLKDLGYL
jgi:arylsulfatase A-like enzyme